MRQTTNRVDTFIRGSTSNHPIDNMNYIAAGILLLVTLGSVDQIEGQGVWLDWGPWVGCDVTCGGGITYRTRECTTICNTGSPNEVLDCNQQECPAAATATPSRYANTLCESDISYNGTCQRNDFECVGGLYTDGLCNLNTGSITTPSASPVTKGWIYHSCCIQGSNDGYSARTANP